MNARTIAYWITTVLAAFVMLAGGVGDLVGPEPVVKIMTHLGYPDYFAKIIGFWKILGAIAVLAPGLPRLKEWAYAGMLFDLTGAAASHFALKDPTNETVTPLVILGIVMASWALRPPARRLGSADRKAADLLQPSISAAHLETIK